MPSQKRSRLVRQEQQRLAGGDKLRALAAADAARDGELRRLRLEYQQRIQALEVEWAEKRREVWLAHRDRLGLIQDAVILRPAGEE